MSVGGAFSFDWTLVQQDVARFATVCSYDVSGTAWSDPGPKLDCRQRVHEVHELMRAAQLKAPYVLVGFSIGACVARLYAAEYPAGVAGMAIVDHAFLPDPPSGKDASFAGLDTPPKLIEQTPIEVSAEDSSDFAPPPPRAGVASLGHVAASEIAHGRRRGGLPPGVEESRAWTVPSRRSAAGSGEHRQRCARLFAPAGPTTGALAPQLADESVTEFSFGGDRSAWVIVAAIRQVVRLTSPHPRRR